VTGDQLRELVVESRRAQGLPPHLEDEAIAAQVVAILRSARDDEAGPRGPARPTHTRTDPTPSDQEGGVRGRA
jgi:hypothetical protein